MARVRQETDTAKVQGSGLGASIEKMVKRTVASTLNQQMEYPLAEVKDAKYEDGKIVLERNDGKSGILANADVNHRKLLESFRPEDAQRFVAAVNAKKGR
jgi:Cu/Ag efflux pump CusA